MFPRILFTKLRYAHITEQRFIFQSPSSCLSLCQRVLLHWKMLVATEPRQQTLPHWSLKIIIPLTSRRCRMCIFCMKNNALKASIVLDSIWPIICLIWLSNQPIFHPLYNQIRISVSKKDKSWSSSYTAVNVLYPISLQVAIGVFSSQ